MGKKYIYFILWWTLEKKVFDGEKRYSIGSDNGKTDVIFNSLIFNTTFRTIQ